MSNRRTIRGVTARARWIDRVGRYLISIGGIGIIAAVMGILLFILFESYPLFLEPRIEQQAAHPVDSVLAIGMDPYQEVAYIARPDGIDFLRLSDGTVIDRHRPEKLVEHRATSAVRSLRDGWVAWALEEGSVLLGSVHFQLDYASGEREVVPRFTAGDVVTLDGVVAPLRAIEVQDDGSGRSAVAAIDHSQTVVIVLREQQQGLLGPGELVEETHALGLELPAEPTKLLIDRRVRRLLVGLVDGRIAEWRLGDVGQVPRFIGAFPASDTAITALTYVLGDVSVAVGDARGRVSTWSPIENESGQRVFTQIHRLADRGGAVVDLEGSLRDKQFISVDDSGLVTLHHMTSEQTSFAVGGDVPVIDAVFAPKADGWLYAEEDGGLVLYSMDNPHPEISLGVLFGKVWYEGYARKEFVWQSTGGSDEFESKISLIPLIFGTAKGTFYAMLFALPLAVLAAIYTSEFATPRVRGIVKPAVEVMASLPSVILGFLAGLWLAPLLEQHMVGTLLLFPLVPVSVIACAWLWQLLPASFRRRTAQRWEIYLLIGVSLLSSWAAVALGPYFERMVFADGFLFWWQRDLGLEYDQRNCLVVGFAMGFAVVPLIFTICEDALSSIPRHLRAGSLALGATRWQTAVRVVLPMALPGIFSASMIGFGRAIGETMIVLMATGNTPILDWDLFNGMRTISANIAVELPEAPHQGTLYRVLFLSGLLLFLSTFAINTLAEVVRQRLRDRYNRL